MFVMGQRSYHLDPEIFKHLWKMDASKCIPAGNKYILECFITFNTLHQRTFHVYNIKVT